MGPAGRQQPMLTESDDRDRVACIELPALPLQLLLREQPRWRALPVAVVEADRPQAKILWINEQARALGVLPGMRCAAARSLAPQLRASVVARERVDQAIDELFALLIGFSPRVEPDPDAPGTLWVDPSGMSLLWGELGAWAQGVLQALEQRGLQAVVVVGFHRFRALAIARSQARPGAWVLGDRRREARMAATVPLDRLGISPRLRDELAGLGVRTLGEFMALPAAELHSRLGAEAKRLHARGSAGDHDPLAPRALVDPVRAHVQIEPAEADVHRLLLRLEPALQDLLARLADRGAAMARLHLQLSLDHAGEQHSQLEPAAPTLDARQLLELLRLRLEAMTLPAGVEAFTLELEGQRTDPRQIALFRAQTRRDLEAGERALARLRASLGPEAVTVAQLAPAHLPEARVSWIPLTSLRFPEARRMQIEGEQPPRIRRLLPRPRPLAAREPPSAPPISAPAASWTLDPAHAPIERLQGPFRASGGWWVRQVERDYYYAHTRDGEVLWVYYDQPRRRWYLHGWLD